VTFSVSCIHYLFLSFLIIDYSRNTYSKHKPICVIYNLDTNTLVSTFFQCIIAMKLLG